MTDELGIREENGVHIITVTDALLGSQFGSKFRGALRSLVGEIGESGLAVLDWSGVTSTDISEEDLHAVAVIKEPLARSGGKVVAVRSGEEAVNRIFEESGFSHYITVYPTCEAAITALRSW